MITLPTRPRWLKSIERRKHISIHTNIPSEEEVQEEVLPGYPQMDALADEDHAHHLTPQEYYYYKSNWRLRSNKTGSDTLPVQRRPDFKQALSTLQQMKQKEEEEAQRNQQWAQSSSSSWWSWQGSWWTPYSYESHHGDEPSTD